MAFILDKETFTKKNIKINRNELKKESHEDMIKYIEETSVIENFIEHFVYDYNTFIIVSDKYVLYSSLGEGEFSYTAIEPKIISLINNDITKTLLIQTEKYIKIFQHDCDNSILKHKFLINFSEIGKATDLLKFDHEQSLTLIVKTSVGIFYIEKNSLKKKSQAIQLPGANKLLNYLSRYDSCFYISYTTENKLITSFYKRYVYDRNEGTKKFDIYLSDKRESEYNTPIYKNPEEKVVDNCQKLSAYTNFISSEIITLNKDGDFIIILENETNKAIVFWEDNYKEKLIVEVPRETKLNIHQNFRSILIYYISDERTNIIVCNKKRSTDGYVKILNPRIREINQKDITTVLYHSYVDSDTVFLTQQNSLIIKDYCSRRQHHEMKISNDEISHVYFYSESDRGGKFIVLYQTKNSRKDTYQINENEKSREITLDFEMSEKNIKSLNELSSVAIIEIGQIILSDDMEDFEF